MSTSASDDSDRTLLERLRASRDAAAVAEVVRRYAGLVYGACLRRQPPASAAASCEAVFQTLIANPGQVAGPLPVWLHAEVMARTGSATGCVPPDAVAEWALIAPHLDPAIAALEPLDRWHVLVGLCALPPRGHAASQQHEFAEALADSGVAAMRQLAERLVAAGVSVAPQQLAAVIDANAIEMPPSELSGRLGHLALAVLPRRIVDTPSAAEHRAKVYLGIAIALMVMVVLLAGVVYALSAKVATERGSDSSVPSSTGP